MTIGSIPVKNAVEFAKFSVRLNLKHVYVEAWVSGALYSGNSSRSNRSTANGPVGASGLYLHMKCLGLFQYMPEYD